MTKHSRLWLYIPWGVAIVLAAVWLVYWNVAANTARGRVAEWVSAQNAAGGQARIGAIKTHGFPVFLWLELDDIHYAPARRNWSAATSALNLNINLTNPQHVIFEQKAPIDIRHADGGHTTLTSRKLLASVRMSGNALAEAGIETNAPAYGDLHADRLLIVLRPDPQTPANTQAVLEADALHLAKPVTGFEPFGQDIAAVHAAMVLGQAGALLETSTPIEAWRAHGGRARIVSAEVNGWGGLDAQARGDVGLDAQHRIDGALEVRLPHPARAFNAMAHSETLSHDAKEALRAMALGFRLAGGRITVHLQAHDGVLSLEGAPVRTLAPTY